VAYDVHLADRVRELLVDGSPVTEQMMFAGLTFLVAGQGGSGGEWPRRPSGAGRSGTRRPSPRDHPTHGRWR
jgi:hypothetical protein